MQVQRWQVNLQNVHHESLHHAVEVGAKNLHKVRGHMQVLCQEKTSPAPKQQ
jgi:hypothetical protein